MVQAMLQRMEVRERERLANDERRHQLEMEEQRKRKVSACVRVGGVASYSPAHSAAGDLRIYPRARGIAHEGA